MANYIVKDLDERWIDVARHGQASLAKVGNLGIAVVDFSVTCIGKTPVLWDEAHIKRLYPLPTEENIQKVLALLTLIKKPMIG